MQDIAGIVQRAEDHCKAHGARLTVKRKQVLTGLIQSNKAISAYELMDFCKEHYGESIPAMSVYRILGFLEAEHLVHKLNLANKYVVCAHISGNNTHGVSQFLICGKCSKVKEIRISPSTMNALQVSVQEAGFKLVNPQLELHGLCDDCLA